MRIPQKFESFATCTRARTFAFYLTMALLCVGVVQNVSAQFSVSSDVDLSVFPGNETDPAVAVNPLAPTNVFVAGVSSTTNGIFTAYTGNLTTWTPNIVASASNTNNLVPAYGEPTVAWDSYSNLFMAYIPTNLQGIAVVVSTNGGKNFSPLTYLATNDVTDQPRLAVGVTGSAAGNVWLVYKDNSIFPPSLVAQGLQTYLASTNLASPLPLPGTNVTDLIGAQSIALTALGTNSITITNNTLTIGNSAPVTLTTNTIVITQTLQTNTNVFTYTFNTNPGYMTTITPSTNTGVGTHYVTNYLIVTRLLGPFSSGFPIPTSISGAFPDIAVGPSNQVMVAYQNNEYSANASSVYVSVNTNTTLTNGFGTPVAATADAAGGLSYIPAEEAANGVNAGVSVAWDANPVSLYYGRAYLSYASLGTGGNMNISSRYSVNAGKTWTAEVQVNDDASANNHFLPRMALDPTTGSVGLCWLDCRNDTGKGANVGIQIPPTPSTNYFTNIYDLDQTPNDDYMVYGTISTNGGTNFLTNIPMAPTNVPSTAIPSNTLTFSSEAASASNYAGLGHHIGLGFYAGNFYPVWPDNTGKAGILPNSNPDTASNFDLYMGYCQQPTADLIITTYAVPPAPTSDESLALYMVVSNTGPFAATNILITNLFPANLEFVDMEQLGFAGERWSQSGQQIVFSFYTNTLSLAAQTAFTNIINFIAVQAGIATNIASVSSTIANPNPNQATFTNTFVIGGEDLSLTMTNLTGTPVDIGTQVAYSLTVTNFGPSANGLVYITNTLSSDLSSITNVIESQGTYAISNNTIIFSLGTIGVMQTATVSYSATAISLGTKYQIASNSAVVVSTDFDTNLLNNYVTNFTQILGEDVGVGITSSPSNVNIGDTITYTLSITNYGQSSNGIIVFSNLLSDNVADLTVQSASSYDLSGSISEDPNLMIFSIGPLLDNEVFTMIYTATALSVSVTDTNITSVVSVSSSDFDTNSFNNVAAAPVVTINGEDLGIGVAAPSSIWSNQIVTFTDMVTNFGPSTNGVINVTNTLSANLTPVPSASYIVIGNQVIFQVGNLLADQTTNLVFTAMPTSLGTAAVLAAVGSDDFDTNLLNNTNLGTTSVIVPPPTFGNLTVTPFASSAFITWVTPTNANVQVAYGPTTNYGNITSLSPSGTNQVVLLTGLPRNATNYFCAMSWEGGTLYTTNGQFFTTNTLILNTSDAAFTGAWLEGSAAITNYYGIYFNTANTTTNVTPTAWATYTPTIPTPGFYNVYAWYPTNHTFSTNAQFYVYGMTNAVSDSINETTNTVTNGQSWKPLATNIYFAMGASGNTTIYNNTGETNKVIAANAMMWTYQSNQDYVSGVIPTWWSTWWSNYLGTNVPTTPANYAAYVSGIPPNGATNSLNFWMTFPTNNTLMAGFSPYQAGRTYTIQMTTNLSNPQWSNLTLTAPTVSTNAFTNNNTVFSDGSGYGVFMTNFPAASQTFFRLAVGLSTNY